MQSTYRPGLIATTLDRLAPIGQLADAIGLQSWINGFVDWAIGLYQRHLSPRKGFSCAHRKLHGGPSCSGYFRELVTTEGFTQAIQPFQQRLVDCRQAHHELRRLAAVDEEDAGEEEGNDRDNASSSNDYRDINALCDISNCALQGCDAADFAACELPHFHACDAGACDFGAVDLGGCDVGGCDVGGCDVGGCDCSF